MPCRDGLAGGVQAAASSSFGAAVSAAACAATVLSAGATPTFPEQCTASAFQGPTARPRRCFLLGIAGTSAAVAAASKPS